MLEYIAELPIFMVIIGFICTEYAFFHACKIFDTDKFNYNGSAFFTEINIGIFIIAVFGLFVHFHCFDFLMRSITDLSRT
jgi:hypothetical protein